MLVCMERQLGFEDTVMGLKPRVPKDDERWTDARLIKYYRGAKKRGWPNANDAIEFLWNRYARNPGAYAHDPSAEVDPGSELGKWLDWMVYRRYGRGGFGQQVTELTLQDLSLNWWTGQLFHRFDPARPFKPYLQQAVQRSVYDACREVAGEQEPPLNEDPEDELAEAPDLADGDDGQRCLPGIRELADVVGPHKLAIYMLDLGLHGLFLKQIDAVVGWLCTRGDCQKDQARQAADQIRERLSAVQHGRTDDPMADVSRSWARLQRALCGLHGDQRVEMARRAHNRAVARLCDPPRGLPRHKIAWVIWGEPPNDLVETQRKNALDKILQRLDFVLDQHSLAYQETRLAGLCGSEVKHAIGYLWSWIRTSAPSDWIPSIRIVHPGEDPFELGAPQGQPSGAPPLMPGNTEDWESFLGWLIGMFGRRRRLGKEYLARLREFVSRFIVR